MFQTSQAIKAASFLERNADSSGLFQRFVQLHVRSAPLYQTGIGLPEQGGRLQSQRLWVPEVEEDPGAGCEE